MYLKIKKLFMFLFVFSLISINCFSKEYEKNDIHFIATGNSDSILICNNGEYALIDGGDNNDEKMLVNYLKEQGIKELKYLILTHPDADHCGGLDAIVKNFSIKTVFVGNGDSDTKTYKDFINSCMNKKLQPSIPLANKEFTLGNGILTFFNQETNCKDSNDNSLITLYKTNNKKSLFMGDAGFKIENKLPLEKIGKIDILKVGHHGSKYATSESFINNIKPRYAIICCGKNNQYGHPHKETIDVLKKYKVNTLRTDINNTIILSLTDKDIKIKTVK